MASEQPPETPSPSSSSQSAPTRQPPPKAPQTLSEWQLLAVLHRANLLQYYETFIDKGGDDVNQIMQCDEGEFLEIMSLVGMLNKPLHVRRLQRTLTQFSKDPTAFNVAAIPQIGAPPVSTYPIGLGATDPMQFFIPTTLCSGASTSTSTTAVIAGSSTNEPTTASPRHIASPSASPIPPVQRSSLSTMLSTIGATANVLTGDYLQVQYPPADSMTVAQYLLENRSPSPLHDDFVSLGDFDPNSDAALGITPTLSDAQIGRLAACSQINIAKVGPCKPKMVQNKKKISQEVLDLIAMHPSNPKRADEFRKFSAIYGRFDAKRKADKVLTLHEVSVNEAAAQICMLVPALLTRRDELFPLARKVVKDAGYHYTKSSSTGMSRPSVDRKRMKSETPTEGGMNDGCSPQSSDSASPTLNVVDDDDTPAKRPKISPANRRGLDQWAAEKMAKKDESQR